MEVVEGREIERLIDRSNVETRVPMDWMLWQFGSLDKFRLPFGNDRRSYVSNVFAELFTLPIDLVQELLTVFFDFFQRQERIVVHGELGE